MYHTFMYVSGSKVPFLGRERLISRLSQHLEEIAESGAGQLLAVRGRRQTGKSRLFTHFAEQSGLPHLYFSAIKNAPSTTQLQEMTRNISLATKPLPKSETLFSTPPTTWTDAFSRLSTIIDQPTIVVIDEFPWAAETDRTLEGALQNAWDRYLQHLPVLFVLIGSDVTVMERLSTHDHPLFGRTKDMVVQPFNVHECAQVLGGRRSAMEVFDAWMVTGGYPRLIADCAKARSVSTFVHGQLTDENNDLVVMGQRVIDAEFPDRAQARRVLDAIGGTEKGLVAFSQIAGRLSSEKGTTEETATTRAVKLLTDVKGVVAVERPIGTPITTKLRRYRIKDSYLQFWYRFIAEQIVNISRGRPDIAQQAFERDWKSWRGKAIEPLVHEAILRLAASDARLAQVENVGGWWNRENSQEIDIVAVERGGQPLFVGSIKWRERTQFNRQEFDKVAKSQNVVPRAANAKLLIVCPAGIRSGVQPDLVLRPDELIDAWRTTLDAKWQS